LRLLLCTLFGPHDFGSKFRNNCLLQTLDEFKYIIFCGSSNISGDLCSLYENFLVKLILEFAESHGQSFLVNEVLFEERVIFILIGGLVLLLQTV
jgi:hypothetical protein